MIGEYKDSLKNINHIREVVICEQLKRMFPLISKIEIMFCAHELVKCIDGFKNDPSYSGGKC